MDLSIPEASFGFWRDDLPLLGHGSVIDIKDKDFYLKVKFLVGSKDVSFQVRQG
jgi:hypothetical protein